MRPLVKSLDNIVARIPTLPVCRVVRGFVVAQAAHPRNGHSSERPPYAVAPPSLYICMRHLLTGPQPTRETRTNIPIWSRS